jgi:hypothetical protein
MEKVVAMTPQTRRKKKPRRGGRRPLPKDFVCIAPDEIQYVLDFIRGLADDHHKEVAKLHFHLCMHCQEMVAELRLINEAAKQRRKELLHCVVTYSGSPVELNCSHSRHFVRDEKQMAAGKGGNLCMTAGGEK